MEQPKQSFFQRHPGFDAYSLFWLVLFLILAALGRFFLQLLIQAGVVLVYLLFSLMYRDQETRLRGDQNGQSLLLLQVSHLRPVHAGPQGGGEN